MEHGTGIGREVRSSQQPSVMDMDVDTDSPAGNADSSMEVVDVPVPSNEKPSRPPRKKRKSTTVPVNPDGTTPQENNTPKRRRTRQSSAAETPTTPHPQTPVITTSTSMPTLEKGVLTFPEKQLHFQRHPATVSDLAAFFAFKDQVAKEHPTLAAIPAVFLPLIAKLVEESALNADEIAKHVQEQLCPPDFGSDAEETVPFLGVDLVERTIKEIATRRNYGLERNGTCPEALAVWRWEVEDLTHFPTEIAPILRQRREQRRDMCAYLQSKFSSLSADEQSKLFPISAEERRAAKEREKHEKAERARLEKEEKAREREREKEEKAKEREREKEEKEREREREKERKAAERLAEKERKATDKRAEKERKAAEKAAREADKKAEEEKEKCKQRSLTGFFSVVKKEDAKGGAQDDGVDAELKRFWDSFPKFHCKERMTVAPWNRWYKDDIQVPASQNANITIDEYLEGWRASKQEYLQSLQKSSPVEDNTTSTKYRLLQFAENIRPAYWGTWSKLPKVLPAATALPEMDISMLDTSRPSVSATLPAGKSCRHAYRNPFFRDATLDYDYDSEAEWEDDEPGEELNSEAEPEDDAEDEEGEEEGWVVPEGYLSEGEGMEDEEGDVRTRSPRLIKDGDGAKRKDRPRWGILKPLTVDIVGLYWTDDGEIPNVLSACRAQVLDGFTLPIDPTAGEKKTPPAATGDKADKTKKPPKTKKPKNPSTPKAPNKKPKADGTQQKPRKKNNKAVAVVEGTLQPSGT
ncbi:hypothetical protein BC832DRAFT_89395 [Gaertneriomyces semiglobifer]|nr:hypothetical protein BC832DRAFT_89395 [Gaertneriomyces semiglobifer]